MLTGILSSVAAAVLVLVVAAIYRIVWARSLRRTLLRALSKKGITDVRSYLETLPRMQGLLASRISDPDLNVVNVLCFMGHDLTFPEDRLVEHLRNFLQAGGTANFLIMDPESQFVDLRAKLLNMNPSVMKQNIENSIAMLNHHFAARYPERVTIRTYDQAPLYRLYFIRDTLIMGFYMDLSSYNGMFYEIPHGSPIYAAMRSWFNLTYSSSSVRA